MSKWMFRWKIKLFGKSKATISKYTTDKYQKKHFLDSLKVIVGKIKK